MIEYFENDGLNYVVTISETGELGFALIGGQSKKGCALRCPSESLWWDEPRFDDADLNRDALAVYKKVQDFVLTYVFTHKVWLLKFTASTKRKARVYRWMAKRLSKKLFNYNLIEYPPGTFSFYRLANPQLAALPLTKMDLL